MSVTDILAALPLKELCDNAVALVVIITGLIQIAPIKINPWGKIARAIGRACTGDILDKLNESEAKVSRYRIIRFDDEIRHGVRHTEEHFNQILDDIKEYEDYCNDHPKFPNGKAISAVNKIKSTYEKCKDENSFL